MKPFFTLSVILLVFLFALPIHAFIGFERWYGHPVKDELGRSVMQTSDGGYIVAGETSEGEDDVYLLKTDSLGDSIWAKTYGGIYLDHGFSVVQTTDDGYIITGETTSFGEYDFNVYLIKTDQNGDTLWTKTYGDTNWDAGHSVAQTTDGGYIITGVTYDSTSNGYYSDVYLIKTDSSGDTLWTRKYGSRWYDAGNSVVQTTDGGYIIAGYTRHRANNVYLIKTDSLGNTLWENTYGNPAADMDDEGYSVAQTSDGGYIITGYSESDTNRMDVYLIKTNSLGNIVWERTYGGDENDEGRSVVQTSDGGYVITGITSSFVAGYNDVLLLKTDSLGDTLWRKTYDGMGDGETEFGNSVQQTSDGGYIIAGARCRVGDWEVYLIKTGEDGNVSIEEKGRDKLVSPRLTVSPNPFTNKVNITYCPEKKAESIELKIYNVGGRLVKDFSLSTGHFLLGTAVSWDGRDNKDKKVPPGIYFVKLSSNNFVSVGKIILVK